MTPAEQLAQYQAPIIARFGYMPPMSELAKHEGPRGTQKPRAYVPPDDTPAAIAMRAANVAKGEATRASIMAVLTKPMTCADVSTALGRTRQLINRHLVILHGKGKVTSYRLKRVLVWMPAVQEEAQ